MIVYRLLWFYFSKATFEWNAAATLAVWVMTLSIQRSNRGDTLAQRMPKVSRSPDSIRTILYGMEHLRARERASPQRTLGASRGILDAKFGGGTGPPLGKSADAKRIARISPS